MHYSVVCSNLTVPYMVWERPLMPAYVCVWCVSVTGKRWVGGVGEWYTLINPKVPGSNPDELDFYQ